MVRSTGQGSLFHMYTAVCVLPNRPVLVHSCLTDSQSHVIIWGLSMWKPECYVQGSLQFRDVNKWWQFNVIVPISSKCKHHGWYRGGSNEAPSFTLW